MRILLATGIYPPKVGGPAYYAHSLKEALEQRGHRVWVRTYGFESYLPTGIRHGLFFLKILPAVLFSDVVLAFDTYAVGLPAVVAGMIVRTPVIIRTGGDFLWEQYVERTHEQVLLSEFYKIPQRLTLKERTIFYLTQWLLRNASRVVFSTQWQERIWHEPYQLKCARVAYIENAYPKRLKGEKSSEYRIISAGRSIFLKNMAILERTKKRLPENVVIDTERVSHSALMEKIRRAYAVVVPSLSEVSPNLILEAIQYGKPFITTKDNGLMDRISDIGIFVDPRDEAALEREIIRLLDVEVYSDYVQRVESFTYTRTYDDIAKDFLSLINDICTS